MARYPNISDHGLIGGHGRAVGGAALGFGRLA